MPRYRSLVHHTLPVVVMILGFCARIPGGEAQTPAAPADTEPTVTEQDRSVLREIEAMPPAEAAARLRNAPETAANPALLFALGSALAQTDDRQGAGQAFAAAVDAMPRFHRARLNLAKLYLGDGRTAEATEQLQNLAASDFGGQREVWMLLGNCLLEQERPEAAEAAWRRALALGEDDPGIRIGLIRCLLEQGRDDDAAGLARRRLDRTPHMPELWALLANAALRRGDDAEATENLECAARLGVAGRDMLATLGDLHADRGLYRQALAAYERAAALEDAPDDRILRGAEVLLAAGRPAEAAVLIDRIRPRIGALPRKDRTRALRLEAKAAARNGDETAARKAFEMALEEDPLDAESLLALGELLEAAGDRTGAAELYARAARMPGFEARALTARAGLYAADGDYAAAVRDMEQALSRREDPALRAYLDALRRAMR